MAEAVGAVALGLEPRAAFELRLSPLLVTFTELLALPVLELEQRIERELERNPALQRVESDGCRWCGGQGACPACIAPPRRETASGAPATDEITQLAAPASTSGSLLEDARLLFPAEDQPIAEYLIGSLDGHGFLAISTAEAADALRVPVERVERVLESLQLLDPPGIAARDARECLLLQLSRLEAAGEMDVPPLARTLVADHLAALGQGQAVAVAATLGVSPADVLAARDFIRRRLWPFPAEPRREPWAAPPPVPPCYPDVIIRASGGAGQGQAGGSKDQLDVQVASPIALGIEPFYRELAERRREAQDAVSAAARRHAADWVRQAEGFLRLLGGRAETIRRVVEDAARHQRAYVRGDVAARRPLTQAAVAQRLGVHESTVSRAVADKLALLPTGRLVPLSAFFDASEDIGAALRRLVDREERPLSDGALAAQLAQLGFRVARRTVAKYRTALGLPAAAARR